MPPLAVQLAGAAPRILERRDRARKREDVLPVRIDLGDGDLGGGNPLSHDQWCQSGRRGCRNLEANRAFQPPAGIGIARLRASHFGKHDPVGIALVPGDAVHLRSRARPAYLSRGENIRAIGKIDVVAHRGILGDRPEVSRFPGLERGGRPGHHALVEREADQRDRHRRNQQRGQDLVRRKPGGAHRDHLGIVVERPEGEQGCQQHRIGQKAGDQLRYPQADIVPQLRLAVARMGQDLAAFGQQVEHLQNQHQQQQHAEDPAHEQTGKVKGDGARREEIELHHATPGLRLIRAAIARVHLPIRAASRSSAPIACPPGT